MDTAMIGGMSLVVFIGTVILGVTKKKNLGILAAAVAFIFGFFVMTENGSMSSAELRGVPITSLFPFNVVWLTVCVSLMMNVGSSNGTFDILIKQLVSLAKGRRAIIPIVIFLAMVFACSIGAGSTGIVVLLCTIAANIAEDQDIDPVFMLLAVLCGATIGVGSPVATIGIMCDEFAMETWGKSITASYIYPRAAALACLSFGAVYIFFKGWKLERRPADAEAAGQKLSGKQWITVAGIVLFIVLSIVLKFDMGLSALLVAAVLLLLGCADEKKVIADVPWSSVILISGMCILVGVVKAAGGMELLVNFLQGWMNSVTVKPIYSILGSLLSMVSSVTGVVLPTMLPTVPDLAASTGANPYALITALAYGSNITCVSPISSMGAIAMGIMSVNPKWDSTRLFKSMFKYSILLMLIAALWAAVGVAG